jgi:hypothetical protein
MLRVANSVENNTSRQTELLDDEDQEEGDQDIPFSSKLVFDVSEHCCSLRTLALNERFYNECQQLGDGPWAYRYSTTKEIRERTINTVYFDIASECQNQRMLMKLNWFCALTSTKRDFINSDDNLPWMFCKNSVIRSLHKRVTWTTTFDLACAVIHTRLATLHVLIMHA